MITLKWLSSIRSTRTTGVSLLAVWSRYCCSARAARRPFPVRASQRGEIISLNVLKSFYLYDVRSPPEYHHAIIQILPNKSKKKSGHKISHLQRIQTQNPQMVCEYRWQTAMTAVWGKEAPSWVALWQLFCLPVSSEHWYVYVTHLVARGAGKEAVHPVFRKLCFCCGPARNTADNMMSNERNI